MKLHLWCVGKAHDSRLQSAIEHFTKRISHYHRAEWKLIPSIANQLNCTTDELKKAEAEMVLRLLHPSDVLILLDEKGKQLTSSELANLLNFQALQSTKNLVFLIGGAFGVHENIVKRAHYIWSLSMLTFPHQLVRLILAEQIYRACTILKNQKYHHA